MPARARVQRALGQPRMEIGDEAATVAPANVPKTAGAAEDLNHYLASLGLPSEFVARSAKRTANVVALEKTFLRWFPQRTFVLGLMLSFLGLVEDVLAQAGVDRMPDALARFPPLEQTTRGEPKKTLTIRGPKKLISLRGYVNRAERVLLGNLKRRDYPSAAPHTTWAWTQHRTELETLLSLTPQERTAYGLFLWHQALGMTAQPTSRREVTKRPFATLLRAFPTAAQKGERSGAALQGMVYAYMHADAPNVTVLASKVRAGSARFGAVGDVDGWYGKDLALTAEVRDLDITDIGGLAGFIRNLSGHRDPTALVVARRFSPEVEAALRAENIIAVTRDQLADNVEIWDLRKQEAAMRHFEHYIQHIERSDALARRFEQFLKDRGLVLV